MQVQRSNKKWWILGGLGCGCLLLIVALVLILGVYGGVKFWNVVSVPREVVHNFLQSVRDGKYETAWNLLSERLRNQYSSFNEFRNTIRDDLPVREWSLPKVSVENETAQVEGVVTMEGGQKLRLTFFLIQEKQQWRLYELQEGWAPEQEGEEDF